MANYTFYNGQLLNTNEIKHYGVLGMKWGRRKNIVSDSPKLKGATSGPINPGTPKLKSTTSVLNDRIKKRQKERADNIKQKAIENVKKKITKENAAKAAAKGARVASKLAKASLVDDVFYNGAGKKIAKETVKQTGRAVVTAYTMANGGYDIRWYDK